MTKVIQIVSSRPTWRDLESGVGVIAIRPQAGEAISSGLSKEIASSPFDRLRTPRNDTEKSFCSSKENYACLFIHTRS